MMEISNVLQDSTQWFQSVWVQAFILIFTVIGLWRMFGEFGEKQWKSLIPVYNGYLMFKHIWNTKTFWIYTILSICFFTLCAIDECVKMTMGVGALVIVVAIVFGIARLVYWIRFVLYLNKAYEYPLWIGIVAIIVKPMVIILYAFGKNRYSGNKSVKIEK